MRRLPVRWRLTLAFAAVMAVVLGVTGAFVHGRLAANLDSATDNALRGRTQDVTALAQQSDTGLLEARAPRSGRGGVEFAQLIDASNRVIDRTPGLSTRPLLPASRLAVARRGARVVEDVVLAADNPVRVAAESIRAQDQQLVVVVGQSLEARNRAVDDLGAQLLVGGPVALLLAAVAGYLLTGAALQPVEVMRRRAASISATNLDGRLPPAARNDELGRLSRTLNEMLARIQSSVARERSFVSDASHELRSPLAMLRTELELLARERPAGPALERGVASAIEETERLTQLTDDLLTLSRADERSVVLDSTRCSVREAMTGAAQRARRRQPVAGVTISVDVAPEATVVADRDRLGQALDNMLDNAMRHAATLVELRARKAAHCTELHVLDDGPGFPAEFLPHAWNRFARADAAHTENGAGLGLAIVKTTAELHGGRAHAENLRRGGADVWITIPSKGPRPRGS